MFRVTSGIFRVLFGVFLASITIGHIPQAMAQPRQILNSASENCVSHTYLDPFGYCKAIGTIDAPDNRYVGPKFPDALIRRMVIQGLVSADSPSDFRKNAIWRCMDNNVWVCQFGANIPCREKADISTDPLPEVSDYCKANPDADVIPVYVTGRTTIYDWTCKDGKPRISRQVINTDKQGYPISYWTELKP